MKLDEIIADLEGFIGESVKVVHEKAHQQTHVDTVDDAICREVIGAVFSSVDENVRVDVLANKLFEATLVVSEDTGDADVFDQIVDFFESLGAELKGLKNMVESACADHVEDDDEDDDDDDEEKNGR